MNRICVLFFCFTIHAFSQEIDSLQIKIVFLSQDVAEGYDHRGGTPLLLAKVEQYFKENYPDNYLKYDLTKLMKNDVKPYYIFNRKYCSPIETVLGANTFIMSRLEIKYADDNLPTKDIYDIFIKVYSSLSGKSKIIFQQKNVVSKDIPELFEKRERELIEKVFNVAMDK